MFRSKINLGKVKEPYRVKGVDEVLFGPSDLKFSNDEVISYVRHSRFGNNWCPNQDVPKRLIGVRLGLRVLQRVFIDLSSKFFFQASTTSRSAKPTRVLCRRSCLIGSSSLNLVGFDFVGFGPA